MITLSNFIILLIFGLLPNIFFLGTYEKFEYPKSLLLYLSVCTIILLTLWKQIKTQKESLKIHLAVFPIDIFILLFILLYLLATLFSKSILTSIFGVWNHQQGGLVFILSAVFLYYYFRFFTKREQELRRIMIIALGGMIFSLVWILLGQDSLIFGETLIRIRSTQGNPIYLANYIMLGFPMALGLFLDSKTKLSRLIFLLCLILVLWGIFNTQTRSVWITVMIMSFVFAGICLFYQKQKFQFKKVFSNLQFAVLLGSILLLIILSVPILQNRLNQTFKEPKPYNSIFIRISEYQSALQITKNYPFLGIGPEAVAYVYPQYRSPELNKNENEWFLDTVQIRNLYLHYATTLGILGAVAFGGIIVIFSFGFFRFIMKRSLNHPPYILIGLFCAWLSLIIHYLFYGATVTTQVFFWSLMGVISEVQNARFNFTLSASKIRLIFLVCLFFSTAVVVIILKDYQSNVLYTKGILDQDINNASILVQESIVFNPYNSHYRETSAFISLRKASRLLLDQVRDEPEISKLLQQAQENLDFVRGLDPLDPTLAHITAILSFKKARLTKNRYQNYHTPEFMQAIGDVAYANKLDPTNPIVLDLLTQIYLEMGGAKLKLAEETAKATMSLKYTFSPAHYHLGEVLKQEGRFDEAIEAYREVFNYYSDDQFAQQEIEKIKFLQKKN